jgi:hypothetical protein
MGCWLPVTVCVLTSPCVALDYSTALVLAIAAACCWNLVPVWHLLSLWSATCLCMRPCCLRALQKTGVAHKYASTSVAVRFV